MRSKPWWVLRVSKAHLDALAAAYALGLFGEDIGVALALIDRASPPQPQLRMGLSEADGTGLWAGEHDTGIKHCETSIRLSPRESKSAPYLGIGMGYLFTRRLEDLAAMLRLAIHEKSELAIPRILLRTSGAIAASARNRGASEGDYAGRDSGCRPLQNPRRSGVFLKRAVLGSRRTC
jgi:hypothetical protein